MATNLTDEIMRIRERLARIETSLEGLQESLEKAPSRGAIVIPVSVVIGIAEILRTVASHYV